MFEIFFTFCSKTWGLVSRKLDRKRKVIKTFGLGYIYQHMMYAYHEYTHGKAFDKEYGIDTASPVTLKKLVIPYESKEFSEPYYPTNLAVLDNVFSSIPDIQNSKLLDVGCGKGRVLIKGFLNNMKSVTGIEFSSELCEICVHNISAIETLTSHKTHTKVLNMDILDYDFDERFDIIFMFNPFNHVVVNHVLEKIVAQKEQIYLCYFHDLYKDLLTKNFSVFKSINLNTTIYISDLQK